MQGQPTGFWGKLAQSADGTIERWHPLEDHCADVAACCEALLRRTLISRRLANLARRADLGESDIQRLAALAAFHDAGKFNLGFQNKAFPNRKPSPAGHVQPFVALFGPDPTTEQKQLRASMPLDEIQEWAADEAGLDLLIAAIAHHGRPVEIGRVVDVPIWRAEPFLGRNPFAGIARLAARVREWFPLAFASGAPPLPGEPRFQHGFCGLVTLADWIGSDTRFFSYSDKLGTNRIVLARSRALEALRALGLDSELARASLGPRPPEFTAIAPFAPRDLQTRLLEMPTAPDGTLALLEAETGSGKTEAALARFVRLFHAGAVDGMYFALPTRTAASQMHERVRAAVRRAFPDPDTRPPVILAVPGYIAVDDHVAQRLPGFEVLWNDDPAERFRFRGWAAETPKRYLAGRVVVGTIDQALLSALAVPHSHLRATSLLRHLLVVDEVHASDAYMTAILREVLQFHLQAGGHALLLSATLGARAATALTAAVQKAPPKVPSFTEAVRVPYPVLTSVVPNARDPAREPLPSRSQVRAVTVEIAPVAADCDAVAVRALDAVQKGARVLVVRNTVRDCVTTQVALEALAAARRGQALLFALRGVCAPHHARFARMDRAALDRELETRFGKDPTAPCVLIATQTVQQSLDIDADLMLTDLCPIDVMLQRIGRLHRHSDRQRAEPFRNAHVIVLTPAERDLTPLIGRGGAARGDHGLGTVYDDLRILEATWRALEATPRLEIPAMNRRLIESATHPEALAVIVRGLGAQWQKHAQACTGDDLARKRLARLNVVNREEPFPECRFPSSLEVRVRARLGQDDRIVDLAAPLPGPFGYPIDRLTIPGWLVRGAPADSGAEAIEAGSGVIRFRFAATTFVYDRLGLRPAEAPSNPEEDIADA